ncbi:MAG TPA: hypothetical protein VNT79_05890 [Phycisphaerae bacterium]|nr:hypothetical protein [Phycisphaerae bacterium]
MTGVRHFGFLVFVSALSIAARAVYAQEMTSGRTVDARLALDAQIATVLKAPRVKQADPLAAMAVEAGELLRLAEQIDAHLRDHPDDADVVPLLLAKLESLYVGSTLRGDGLDRLEAEFSSILKETDSPAIAEAAEYWRTRKQLNRVRAAQALGQSDGDEAVELMRAFARDHPSSKYAVQFARQVLEHDMERGALDDAAALLKVLEEHHPRHAITEALSGQYRLRKAIDAAWRPVLHDFDGQLLPWDSAGGATTIVVFWSPTHTPSVRMLETLARIHQRAGAGRFRGVAVALHRDAALVREKFNGAISDAVIRDAWITAQEKGGWSSAIAGEYGIRSLPTILILGADLRLQKVHEPREWGTQSDIEKLLGLSDETSATDVLSTRATTVPTK